MLSKCGIDVEGGSALDAAKAVALMVGQVTNIFI